MAKILHRCDFRPDQHSHAGFKADRKRRTRRWVGSPGVALVGGLALVGGALGADVTCDAPSGQRRVLCLANATGGVVESDYTNNIGPSKPVPIMTPEATVGADPAFTPVINGQVSLTIPQSDGKILIAGSFTMVDGVFRNSLARLTHQGRLDAAFAPSVTSLPSFVLPLEDGRIFVSKFPGVARLLSSGAIDASFATADLGDGGVRAVGIQADGRLIVATMSTIRRLNVDGTVDPAFVVPMFSGVTGELASSGYPQTTQSFLGATAATSTAR